MGRIRVDGARYQSRCRGQRRGFGSCIANVSSRRHDFHVTGAKGWSRVGASRDSADRRLSVRGFPLPDAGQ